MTARQAIVEAFVDQLLTITVSNGYATDVGDSVFAWYPQNLAVPGSPCILVQDTEDTITTLDATQLEHTLRIEVEGQVTGDEDLATTIWDTLGDIVKCILNTGDRTLGGVCDSIQPATGGVVSIEQRAEDVVGACEIHFEVKFRTNRGDWSVKV